MITNKELLDYLDYRGIKDNDYRLFVQQYCPDDYKFIMCSINGFDYAVSHFLDKSEKMGYGLISTNEGLQTEKEGQIIIGLIEGDDAICLDPKTGQISLWLIQTGDNEHIIVADSFNDFIKMCCDN